MAPTVDNVLREISSNNRLIGVNNHDLTDKCSIPLYLFIAAAATATTFATNRIQIACAPITIELHITLEQIL